MGKIYDARGVVRLLEKQKFTGFFAIEWNDGSKDFVRVIKVTGVFSFFFFFESRRWQFPLRELLARANNKNGRILNSMARRFLRVSRNVRGKHGWRPLAPVHEVLFSGRSLAERVV